MRMARRFPHHKVTTAWELADVLRDNSELDAGSETSSPSLFPVPTEEAMQLRHTRLTPEVCQRRQHLGLCFYCGQEGHRTNSCPDQTFFKPGCQQKSVDESGSGI